MGYTDAALDAAVDGIAGAGTWISFHDADPGTTGANAVGSREQTTWGAAASGTGGRRERVGSQVSATIPGGHDRVPLGAVVGLDRGHVPVRWGARRAGDVRV